MTIELLLKRLTTYDDPAGWYIFMKNYVLKSSRHWTYYIMGFTTTFSLYLKLPYSSAPGQGMMVLLDWSALWRYNHWWPYIQENNFRWTDQTTFLDAISQEKISFDLKIWFALYFIQTFVRFNLCAQNCINKLHCTFLFC